MFVTAVRAVQLAMFPVFVTRPLPDGRTEIAAKGSAFFIDEIGTFMTCAHLVPHELNGAVLEYRGRPPETVHNPTLPICEIYRNDAKDILIGHVNVKTPGYLSIAEATPDAGRSVCICGYPMPRLSTSKSGALEVGGVRRYFQPTFVLDRVLVVDGKRGLNYDGIVTRDLGLFGMSGGPIVDVEAKVVAMQSLVTAPRVSEGDEGRKLIVENAIGVSADELHSAIKTYEENHRVVPSMGA